MKLSKKQAKSLCDEIISSLKNWTALANALQGGGLEDKATCRIEMALEAWMKWSRLRFVLLHHYRDIDFALIEPNPRPIARLAVDTAIEVKFNYATQARHEIPRRLREAIAQVSGYKKAVGASDAYVLYLVADPRTHQKPEKPRDTGWAYWRGTRLTASMDDAIRAIADSAATLNRVPLGVASNGRDPLLYCALIAA